MGEIDYVHDNNCEEIADFTTAGTHNQGKIVCTKCKDDFVLTNILDETTPEVYVYK